MIVFFLSSCKKEEQHDPTIYLFNTNDGSYQYTDSIYIVFRALDKDDDIKQISFSVDNSEVLTVPIGKVLYDSIPFWSDLLTIGPHVITVAVEDVEGNSALATINVEIFSLLRISDIKIINENSIDVMWQSNAFGDVISAGVIISDDTLCTKQNNSDIYPATLTSSYTYTTRIQGLTQSLYFIKVWVETNAGIKYSPGRMVIPYNNGEYTDTRNGTVYKWVEIDGVQWLTENLNYLPWVKPFSLCYNDTNRNIVVLNYTGNNVEEAKATSEYLTEGVRYSLDILDEVVPEGWDIPSYEQAEKLSVFLNRCSYFNLETIYYNDIITYKGYTAYQLFGLKFGQPSDYSSCIFMMDYFYFWIKKPEANSDGIIVIDDFIVDDVVAGYFNIDNKNTYTYFFDSYHTSAINAVVPIRAVRVNN